MSLLSSTVTVPAAVAPKAQMRAGATAVRPTNVPCIAARSALFGSVRGFQAAGSSRRIASRATRVAVPQAMLKVGDRLQDNPDYYRVMKATDGNSYALSTFAGKKPIVLFFYPSAGTPGCTKEVCSFRDEYSKLKASGAEVFGISGDAVEKNKTFAQMNRLPFPLLTDPGNFLRKSFGVKGDLLGLLPGRQTFVFDKNGKVLLSYNNQLEPESHVAQALNVLKTVTV